MTQEHAHEVTDSVCGMALELEALKDMMLRFPPAARSAGRRISE